MRFIFNFIFFGILFYLIYVFFPDAFAKLVSWADVIYTFFRDLGIRIMEKIQGSGEAPAHASLLLLVANARNLLRLK